MSRDSEPAKCADCGAAVVRNDGVVWEHPGGITHSGKRCVERIKALLASKDSLAEVYVREIARLTSANTAKDLRIARLEEALARARDAIPAARHQEIIRANEALKGERNGS